MKCFYLLFAFMLLFGRGFAQNADSLIVTQEVYSLIQVSDSLITAGDLDGALELNIAAEKIALDKLGRASAVYGTCCHNRGIIHGYKGDAKESEKWFLEAKNIWEKVLGKRSEDYLGSLANLARHYWLIGNYEKAELLFLEAKASWENVMGKENPVYSIIINNMGGLYFEMGNYEKAEPLILEASAIWEKAYGKENPEYANNLNNQALVYLRMGNNDKAELLFLEASAIWEKAYGKENPEYAIFLDNLAVIYKRMGTYDKAEPFMLEAKSIREKILGNETRDYAYSTFNLGELYYAMGNYDKAERFFLETKDILIKVLGKDHLDYAINLNQLAEMYEIQKRFSASERLLAEASALEQARLYKSMSFLSERELANFAAKIQENEANLGGYLLARSRTNKTGTLPALAFDIALFQKGFLLTAAARLSALAASSPESEAINLLLKNYHRNLAAEYAKPITDRKGVAELEEKANASEKELANTVAGYAEAIRQVKWQDVQTALKKDETAIEFLHFKVFFPKKTDSTMYAALVLRPGAEQPKFIPLFEEKQLDSLFKTSGERKADYVNNLYSLSDRGVIVLGKPQKSLYELLWKPLEKELAGAKTVYFSTSGLLHRLNFSAVPVSQDSMLADKYELVELGSTRQLVVPQQFAMKNNYALLFGGIQYDMDSTAIISANSGLENGTLTSRGGLSFSQTDPTLRSGSWNYLPGTEKEIVAVAKMMQNNGIETQSRSGWEATEEAFKTIGQNQKQSPRILHFATHGFFFPDPKYVSYRQSALGEDQEPVFRTSDNPLIRSGMLLAGANYAWSRPAGSKSIRPDMEDGILTAYEISQMNLSHTELVVLSACETGLGDIQGNEGVYGLQRAFKIAGVRYLIMSLWQVPDKQTSHLMITFYKKWLEEKMEIPEAFRAAQKELREAGLDPYQWAGFILME